MNKLQRSAWYKIIIVLVTAAAIGVLYLAAGKSAATGGFALLALLGLDPVFVRAKAGEVVGDEDARIARRSMMLAYGSVGVACFTLTMFAPSYYGEDGSIPVGVAQFVLLGACMVFVLLQATALLYFYSRLKGRDSAPAAELPRSESLG